jgi:hypothetical protein
MLRGIGPPQAVRSGAAASKAGYAWMRVGRVFIGKLEGSGIRSAEGYFGSNHRASCLLAVPAVNGLPENPQEFRPTAVNDQDAPQGFTPPTHGAKAKPAPWPQRG